MFQVPGAAYPTHTFADTKWFRFEYTLPQHVFEPYRDAMEAYFSEFARTWNIKYASNIFWHLAPVT